jgi:hypothetical protein
MDRLPLSTKIMAKITEEDYPLFLKSMPADERLPPNYADWYARFAHEDAAHRSAGMDTLHVLVRHGELIGFLRRVQLKPTYGSLQTYAAFVGGKTLSRQPVPRHMTPKTRK